MHTKHVIEDLQKNEKEEKDLKEREMMAGYRKAVPKLTRSLPVSTEQRGESSDGSWAVTGPQPVDETQDEGEGPNLYNTNISREELEMVMELRKSKEHAEK